MKVSDLIKVMSENKTVDIGLSFTAIDSRKVDDYKGVVKGIPDVFKNREVTEISAYVDERYCGNRAIIYIECL